MTIKPATIVYKSHNRCEKPVHIYRIVVDDMSLQAKISKNSVTIVLLWELGSYDTERSIVQ